MCEFKVYLNGKRVYEDAVYAKSNSGRITVKNILGESKEFRNCSITEVDVTAERLNLERTEP